MDWIDNGLHFSCGQCGNCCTGDPGYVWCTPDELQAMASALSIEFEDFTREYVRRIGDAYSLNETATGNCVLWDKEQGCQAYSARPVQCRTWPFWPEIVSTREAWQAEAGQCLGLREGLANQGTFHSVEQIRSQVALSAAHDPNTNI